MSIAFDAALRARLAGNIARFARQPIADGLHRAAAVAIVVVEGDRPGEAAILLTRRPDHLRRHARQFALPGGRLDAGETIQAAALRELHEELGLALGPADVIGVLDDYPTRSGFRITPVVAWAAHSHALVPDANEVAKVFRIPLTDLESEQIPHLEATEGGGAPVLSTPLASLGHRVYAPTAALLYQFREVALRGADTRVAHFDQPRFAWS